MKRKDFIRQTLFTSASISLLGGIQPLGRHIPTPEETEGPFPTHQPATLVAQRITADRPGTPLNIHITIHDLNRHGAGCKDMLVDIWHCDNKGEYSEYGGAAEKGHGGPGGMPLPPGKRPGRPFPAGKNMPPPGGGMQATDYTKLHFLRGRQTTDANGRVAFQSIYPGWYPGRAPHIHVHIFNPAGQSLLVTQIAFPEHTSRQVYSQGVYAVHGLPDTSNKTDNVFNDSIANELATLAGNAADGYTLSHSIYVKV